jgi:serine/threonine kinase 38
MFKEIPLETLLKNKKINQRTYEKVKIAKEYIERKYNLKTMKDSKYNAILEKLNSKDISDEEKNKILEELHQESEELRKSRQKQTIRDYESLTVIGRGAFGEVHVCRVIKTGDIVAIKKIKKELLAKKNQIIHVRNEQLFMSKVKSPWIVDLKASFQEDDFLYLVMEFLPGGDFMNLLIEKDKLTEEEARFYIAELILAVDSIHKLDCIHRDIKPDNILIDKNGHIKLSDFGLAKVSDKLYEQNSVKDENFNPKKMTHKKLYSCVGTAYYVAPEVLNKKGYGQEIDWWSVGVIFFEMLVGYAPFCAQETQEVCFKILNWEKYLQIPPEIKLSNEANDLIKRMISDPNKRLGKNGADEIKAHPFFKGVDWEHIRETMKPPFVPEIKNDYDTKYFETFEIEEPFYPPIRKIPKRKDFEYLGFTYKKEDDLDNVITNMINKSKEGNDNNEEKKSE